MLEWLNFGIMVSASILFLVFYVKSVSPAALEQKIGEAAYPKCGRYRAIAMLFEMAVIGTYVAYIFYPLPLSLSHTFPWAWWISAIIAIVIGIPSGYVMIIGLKDAGKEAIAPQKDQPLYGGIYQRIRHPQAVGEVVLWWVVAFFLHSPFLAIYSFIFIPNFYLMCWAEEKDLVLRFGAAYEDYRKTTGMFFPKRRKNT